MNAIELLRSQHREVERLFDSLEAAGKPVDRQRIFNELADTLAIHASLEERLFYPACTSIVGDDLIQESLDEHLEMKKVLAELLDLDPDDDEFLESCEELRDDVDSHVEEEESELFPQVRKELGAERLDRLGAEMVELASELREQGEPRMQIPAEAASPEGASV